MPAKKKSKDQQVTQTRCSIHAQKEIKALSERLYKGYSRQHIALGFKRPCSRVAVDALLYWAALTGVLNGKQVTDENNIFSAMITLSEEE